MSTLLLTRGLVVITMLLVFMLFVSSVIHLKKYGLDFFSHPLCLFFSSVQNTAPNVFFRFGLLDMKLFRGFISWKVFLSQGQTVLSGILVLY